LPGAYLHQKDCIFVLLFIKYISDKYTGVPFAPITVPPDARFADMVAFKGKSDIGDQINKKIIEPLVNATSSIPGPTFPTLTTRSNSAMARKRSSASSTLKRSRK